MSLRILFVSSEAVPFAKSGGLGDAVSALAWTLARNGHDVKVVLPRYCFIDRSALKPMEAEIEAPERRKAKLYTLVAEEQHEGTAPDFLFLEFEPYYGRDGIYGAPGEPGYPDNPARFAFLSRSALLLGQALGWHPDVIHAHDWPSALVALYRALLLPDSTVPVVLTVHNGGYQGEFSADWLKHLRLPEELARQAGIYHFGRLNFLKSGIVLSDEITTVSPSYARQLEEDESSYSLAPNFRSRHDSFTGIVNGIDYEIWNPESDPHLSLHYSSRSLENKARLKEELQSELGLSVRAAPAVIGMVTRLAGQKGIRELFEPGFGCMQRILEELPVQVALIGNGEPWCEEEIRRLAGNHASFRAVIGFDEGIAHRVEAGSDFFLMPSKYEPCGLNQMYSLRYGTVPIVTATGGLADTVSAYDASRDSGTGFLIAEPSPQEIFSAVRRAVELRQRDPSAIKRMRVRGMQERFSWDHAAQRYLDVYRSAREKRSAQHARSWQPPG